MTVQCTGNGTVMFTDDRVRISYRVFFKKDMCIKHIIFIRVTKFPGPKQWDLTLHYRIGEHNGKVDVKLYIMVEINFIINLEDSTTFVK
jgi:hypothetical protein